MEKLEDYVKFLRALASSERISILEAIEKDGEISASQVEKQFFMEQSTASHHLNILKRAGILEPRKTGRNIFYHIKEANLKKSYKEFLEALHRKQVEKLAKKQQEISSKN